MRVCIAIGKRCEKRSWTPRYLEMWAKTIIFAPFLWRQGQITMLTDVVGGNNVLPKNSPEGVPMAFRRNSVGVPKGRKDHREG